MSELQAYHCMTPEQRTWLLCTGPMRGGTRRTSYPGGTCTHAVFL